MFCENVALAETSGVRPFWYLKENRVLDPGYDQGGSLDRTRIENSDETVYPDFEKYIEHCEVRCVTVRELLASHSVSRVDVFLIDTEGYDAKVLDQIDLATDLPSVIIYEHLHLSPSEKERCLNRLKAAQYETSIYGGNTIAVLPMGLRTR